MSTELKTDLTDLLNEQRDFGQIETKLVTDLDRFHMAAHDLAKLEDKRVETHTQADKDRKAAVDPIDNWEASEIKAIDDREAFLQHEMAAYYLNTEAKGTISTPWGKLKPRHTKAAPEVGDRKALAARLLAAGETDLVTTKTTTDVKWAELKKTLRLVEGNKWVDENGEVIPEVTTKPETNALAFTPEVK